MTPITISVNQACASVGIGKTKLYQLINDGTIVVVRLGRRTLVRTDSLFNLVSKVL